MVRGVDLIVFKINLYKNKKVLPSIYKRRSKYLLENNVESYLIFLKSNIWKNLKKKIMASDNIYWHRCIICGSTIGLELHHVKYKRVLLKTGDLKNIRPLCREHHQETHDLSREKDLTLLNAFRKLTRKYNVNMSGVKTSLTNQS